MRPYAGGIQQGAARPLWQDRVLYYNTHLAVTVRAVFAGGLLYYIQAVSDSALWMRSIRWWKWMWSDFSSQRIIKSSVSRMRV